MGLGFVVRTLLFAGAASLGGCYPLAQGPTNATAGLSPTSSYELMYGRAGPSQEARPAVSVSASRGIIAATAMKPTPSAPEGVANAATDPVVFSDEWWKRENEADTKISRATKICRC